MNETRETVLRQQLLETESLLRQARTAAEQAEHRAMRAEKSAADAWAFAKVALRAGRRS